MTTEERGLISTFDEQPSQYFPGYVITWHSGEDHGYELYDLETGTKTPLYDVDATDSAVAIYTLDGSYPLCNDFYAVIHPDAAADSPERQLYDWLDTADGIACIQKAGYVPAQSAAKTN